MIDQHTVIAKKVHLEYKVIEGAIRIDGIDIPPGYT
jgi:hypothetical protein